MASVAVGIFCKTPAAGLSKTRLSPPLRPEDCSAISACFIRDLASTINLLGRDVTPYTVYTPIGTEPALRALLPPSFRLLPQRDGDFGTRLSHAVDGTAAMPAMRAQFWSTPTAPRCLHRSCAQPSMR